MGETVLVNLENTQIRTTVPNTIWLHCNLTVLHTRSMQSLPKETQIATQTQRNNWQTPTNTHSLYQSYYHSTMIIALLPQAHWAPLSPSLQSCHKPSVCSASLNSLSRMISLSLTSRSRCNCKCCCRSQEICCSTCCTGGTATWGDIAYPPSVFWSFFDSKLRGGTWAIWKKQRRY